jgi:hypothetical protein
MKSPAALAEAAGVKLPLSKQQEAALRQAAEEEARIKAKRRMLGNIRFIGELYKKKMLKVRACDQMWGWTECMR